MMHAPPAPLASPNGATNIPEIDRLDEHQAVVSIGKKRQTDRRSWRGLAIAAAAALLVVSIGVVGFFSSLGPGGSGGNNEEVQFAALPAMDIATPPETLAASPAALADVGSTSNGVFIVEGESEQAGIIGDVTIATLSDDVLTVPLADGDIATFTGISGVDASAFDGKLLAYRENQAPIALDLKSGEVLHELPRFQNYGREYGRWYMVPTDDELTDWTIADIATGETRLLSEIVDLPAGESVMPFPAVSAPLGTVRVFEIQPGEPGNQGWVPPGPPITHIAISESHGHMVELSDFPTARDRVHSPLMVDDSEGRLIAYETRTDDDRIVIVDTATGEELTRYGADAVGEDPILASFMDNDTLMIASDGRVMALSTSGNDVEVIRGGLESTTNLLLYQSEEVLYCTQGDAVMRLSLQDGELTEVATGFVPGAFDFTRREGSDWIFFQTQDGVTMVDAASGEIVSQMKLPGARGGLPDTTETLPSWADADGDTRIIGMETQGLNTSGVPGAVWLLSPEHPNGLDIPGPSDEHSLANARLSPDGTTLYATTSGQVLGEGDLWMTPLDEESAWELVAEDVRIRTFIPTNP